MIKYTILATNGDRIISGLASDLEYYLGKLGLKLTGITSETIAAPVVERTDLPFKTGDKVFVTGDSVKGQATVLACWCNLPPSTPKWDRPLNGHPQVEVQMTSGPKAGVKFHFHKADIDAGKITKLVY
jgi:hypothetical protein